jgi:regulator of extracellular matrix RemA (YlzA/DUF370 family)
MPSVALNVGFYNYVVADKVLALISCDSAPMRRLIQEYRKGGRLIDATQGRKTKSIVFLEGGQVATSALSQETLARRLNSASFVPEPESDEEAEEI